MAKALSANERALRPFRCGERRAAQHALETPVDVDTNRIWNSLHSRLVHHNLAQWAAHNLPAPAQHLTTLRRCKSAISRDSRVILGSLTLREEMYPLSSIS